MCGRYIPNTEDEVNEIREILSEIAGRIAGTEIDFSRNNGDVFPSTVNPVILSGSNGITVDNLKWGFTKWDGKGAVINAKSETVEKSPFFSPHLGSRCVIAAHGYYEWMNLPDKSKQKYSFISKSGSGIYMAGLYRRTPESSEFVILTTGADDNVRFIHDRMPLLMTPDFIYPWLSAEVSPVKLRAFSPGVEFDIAG